MYVRVDEGNKIEAQKKKQWKKENKGGKKKKKLRANDGETETGKRDFPDKTVKAAWNGSCADMKWG